MATFPFFAAGRANNTEKGCGGFVHIYFSQRGLDAVYSSYLNRCSLAVDARFQLLSEQFCDLNCVRFVF